MKKLIIIVSLILLLANIPTLALAQGPGLERSEGVQVHFGNNVVLKDGDSVEGGAVVIGGNFTMEEGSEVEGDVVVFGGNVKIDGDVEGDVATLGGNVDIRSHAVIDGDVTAMGGNVRVSEEAEVSGVVADGLQIEIDQSEITIPAIPDIEFPNIPLKPEVSIPDRGEGWRGQDEHFRSGFMTGVGRFIGDGVQDIFWALIVAGLSVLMVLFFPANVRTVQDTLKQSTPTSFMVGLVTIAAIFAVLLLLAILFFLIVPLCGIVFILLVAAAGWLGGWAVIGRYFGRKIFNRFDNPTPSEISATFLGVMTLTVLATMPFVDNLPLIGGMFSLVGFLVTLLVSATGLGAIVLTRFGTQMYHANHAGTGTTAQPMVSEGDKGNKEADDDWDDDDDDWGDD